MQVNQTISRAVNIRRALNVLKRIAPNTHKTKRRYLMAYYKELPTKSYIKVGNALFQSFGYSRQLKCDLIRTHGGNLWELLEFIEY